MPAFCGLSAVLLNCSLVRDGSESHTRRLLARVAGIMREEGVEVDLIHVRDHQVGFGMVKDTTEIGDARDDWPAIHARGRHQGVCEGHPVRAVAHRIHHPAPGRCGWIGEVGPGPSYGDTVEGSDVPTGYDSEFTNKNATIMTWNLMHTATMLHDLGGFPRGGNSAASWREYTNAADQNPDRRA